MMRQFIMVTVNTSIMIEWRSRLRLHCKS